MTCARFTSLRYYATIALSYWKFAVKVHQSTLVLFCLYGGKQVGGNDNPDLAGYGC